VVVTVVVVVDVVVVVVIVVVVVVGASSHTHRVLAPPSASSSCTPLRTNPSLHDAQWPQETKGDKEGDEGNERENNTEEAEPAQRADSITRARSRHKEARRGIFGGTSDVCRWAKAGLPPTFVAAVGEWGCFSVLARAADIDALVSVLVARALALPRLVRLALEVTARLACAPSSAGPKRKRGHREEKIGVREKQKKDQEKYQTNFRKEDRSCAQNRTHSQERSGTGVAAAWPQTTRQRSTH